MASRDHQDKPSEKVHTLAIADLRLVYRVCLENIPQLCLSKIAIFIVIEEGVFWKSSIDVFENIVATWICRLPSQI